MVLDLSSGDIVAEFRSYVKPVVNPILSKLCRKITSISQVRP